MRKANGKRETELLEANYRTYLNSDATELWDVYGSFSTNKARAFNSCKELCKSLDGENLKIISHNCHIFTAGFTFFNNETGAQSFAFITPLHDRYIEL